MMQLYMKLYNMRVLVEIAIHFVVTLASCIHPMNTDTSLQCVVDFAFALLQRCTIHVKVYT